MVNQQKDPLLLFLSLAAVGLTALSVATWLGRPGPQLAPTAKESQELRALASVETGSAPSAAPGQQWEVAQISVNCQDSPDQWAVPHHQHQVQFKLVGCSQLDENTQVELVAEGQPLILFSSDRPGLIDSEILQLKEGTNTIVLRWRKEEGAPFESRTFQIQRS